MRLSTTRARAADERGVTLIEAALVMPIFISLIFGIMEFALVVNGNVTLAAATSDGSRAAAVYGNDARADMNIVRDVAARTFNTPQSAIVRIVVFKASGPNDSVPTSCKNGTPTSAGGSTGSPAVGACNVYSPSVFASVDPEDFDCSNDSPSRHYCPTGRKVAAQGTNGPPDYLGIYVRMRHDFLTGLFQDTMTLERTSVVRLEPQGLN